jgi:VIT1/CCC1 family predicted Fe2+/Mn2+ transporter
MRLADYIGKYWAGAEVMYGVIIAMTFTSILRGYPAVFEFALNRTISAALLCCMAWGVADGLFYFWERSYIIRTENRIIRSSKLPREDGTAVSLIGNQLDDTILRNVPEEKRLQLYEKLKEFLSGVDIPEKLSSHDAATILLGTFLLSAGAGCIIVAPFFVIHDVEQALKVSNLLGIVLLFLVGYFRALDRDFFSKVMFGFGSSLVGIVIAGITIVLGG